MTSKQGSPVRGQSGHGQPQDLAVRSGASLQSPGLLQLLAAPLGFMVYLEAFWDDRWTSERQRTHIWCEDSRWEDDLQELRGSQHEHAM